MVRSSVERGVWGGGRGEFMKVEVLSRSIITDSEREEITVSIRRM